MIFDPSKLSKVKSDGANQRPWGPTYKYSGVQPRIYHRFLDILRQKDSMLSFDPSGSSKVKLVGANRKPRGTFLSELC